MPHSSLRRQNELRRMAIANPPHYRWLGLDCRLAESMTLDDLGGLLYVVLFHLVDQLERLAPTAKVFLSGRVG